MICPPSDTDEQIPCFPYNTKRRPADWWKTCVSCGMNQTQRDTAEGCAACLEEKQEHVRHDTTPNSCKTCASCEEVIENTLLFDLADAGLFGIYIDQYYVQRVTASCRPLRRRIIEFKNGVLQVAGDDYWRPLDSGQGRN